MHSNSRFQSSIFGGYWSPANATLSVVLTLLFLLFLFLFVAVTTQPAQAQTYKILHNFTGGADGAVPTAGVTVDAAGNLYGTTSLGGYFGTHYNCGANGGCGTVFKLALNRGAWTESVLHAFTGRPDGAVPNAGVVFGPDGQLYGTTSVGGRGGTVFSLRPAATTCTTTLCNWTETVLTELAYQCSGNLIGYGDVAFDELGAVLGTTFYGGSYDVGTIFRVYPSEDGWTCQDEHSFSFGTDGGNTDAGVILVGGQIYGTATLGGPYPYVYGTVYTGWGPPYVLHAFENGADGAYPFASLTSDASGNVYGTTQGGGTGGGTVFEVTPLGAFSVLYSFVDGGDSLGPLNFDGAGNLYGTLGSGGAQAAGSVFKLTPGPDGWTYTPLHDFSGSDGTRPYGKVTIDPDGNLYGTASRGGAYGYGVVWEITRN